MFILTLAGPLTLSLRTSLIISMLGQREDSIRLQTVKGWNEWLTHQGVLWAFKGT